MEHMAAWWNKQWAQKKFRILVAAMLLLAAVLGFEFYLFQYGVLKIARYFILFWSLVAIAWIDQGSKKIPNEAVLFLFFARTLILLLECLFYRDYWISILESASMGFLLSGGMFLLCFLISKGAIGAGDVKLVAALGYYLGMGAVFTAIFLTVVVAAAYGMIALLLKKASLKQEIPFAPFILAGTVITMMLGI